MDTSGYTRYRPQMQSGDLVSFSGQGIVSKLIQWRTGSIFSHVGMVIVDDRLDGDERVLLLHSTFKTGVVHLPVSTFLSSFQGKAYWHPLDHGWAAQMNPDYKLDLLRQAVRLLGRTYDLRGAARFALPFIEQTTMAYFCSELSATCYQGAKLWYETWKSPARMAPVDAVNLPIFQPCVEL